MQRGDIDVIAPGFAADCTPEEIAIRYASLYRSHGGGELRYIPALNDSPGHIKALASLLRRHLRGWAPGRVSLEGGCGLEFRPLIRGTDLNWSFHVLDYLLQYGLFLAEVTTVVIAIGVVIRFLFKTIRHAREYTAEHLE